MGNFPYLEIPCTYKHETSMSGKHARTWKQWCIYRLNCTMRSLTPYNSLPDHWAGQSVNLPGHSSHTCSCGKFLSSTVRCMHVLTSLTVRWLRDLHSFGFTVGVNDCEQLRFCAQTTSNHTSHLTVDCTIHPSCWVIHNA